MIKHIAGTSLVFEEKGILLLGPSGSGKSDLALQLIDQGALLIADDQTFLTCKQNEVILTCPKTIKGLLEIRGIGIVTVPYEQQAKLHFVFQLNAYTNIERLPEKHFISYFNLDFPFFEIDPFQASTIARIRFLVKNQGD